MKKIFMLAVILLVMVVGTVAFGAQAFLNDTETSSGNTFTAGVIDLEVGGIGTSTLNVTGMSVGSQVNAGWGSWDVENVGSINGILNISNITLTNYENVRLEPEVDAGDPTAGNPGAGNGELQNVLNIRIFLDIDGDGWIGVGETVIYNGLMNGLPGSITFNYPLNAGATLEIQPIVDWCDTGYASDSPAMSDSVVLDITFSLIET